MEKEEKDEFLKKLEKAASPEYITTWDDKGIPSSKKKIEVEKGKKSRKSGVDFEARVRKFYEDQGWVVAKWPNQVDLQEHKIIPSKRKFNPFSKVMTIGTGFPDFVIFKHVEGKSYIVWGVEVKVNGYLDREEKEKCAFLLDNKIFSEIVIAKKVKDGREVKVEEVYFSEKFMKD